MKTFRCEYEEYIDGKLIMGQIQAESHQEAYEKFLASEGTYKCSVIVTSGVRFGTREIFKDHISLNPAEVEAVSARVETARVKATRVEAADAKRQEMHAAATADAEASLTSTDMLLKQLIAKQDETNQWLCKIRRALISIFIIIAMWHLFGWRIIPIR